MLGCCVDMDAILEVARKHSLLVIEDCAQACGGTYKGRMLGSIGDMGCFSISSYKIIGGGEGGLVLTDDEWLFTRAQNQHDTAACWRPSRFAVERKPGELFCGQNYRMSELEGTVNLVQIKKMASIVEGYRAAAGQLTDALEEFPETRLRPSNDPEGDVGYRVGLQAADAEKAARLIEALQAEGVPCGGRGDKVARDWHIYSYWDHIMEQKSATSEGCPFTCPYREAPPPAYKRDMCPRATDLLSRTVFINVNNNWTGDEARQVASAINKVCSVLG
jgi:8-amino-3,8-dideoxy-alpha-D-manno-octulosonate transaminase